MPLHVARMLACDGARVDVTLGEGGEFLDIGRRTRAIPSAILVLVCSAHHHMIHEDALSTEIRGDKIVFIDSKGRELPNAGPSAATGHDLEELEQFLRDADLHIDASTGYPGWDGARMDLGDSLAWMLMAHS